jgi:hypothetical protein
MWNLTRELTPLSSSLAIAGAAAPARVMTAPLNKSIIIERSARVS